MTLQCHIFDASTKFQEFSDLYQSKRVNPQALNFYVNSKNFTTVQEIKVRF